MTRNNNILFVLAFCFIVAGCSGGTFVVKKNPGDDVEGFRYHLPKPYLLVSDRIEVDAKGKKTHVRDARIIYLPDIDNEYSIDVEGGVGGTFSGSLNLEDGWNLTQVNQEYDTKTAETIGALASLVGEIKPFMPMLVPVEPPKPKPFELYEIDLKNKKLIRVTFE